MFQHATSEVIEQICIQFRDINHFCLHVILVLFLMTILNSNNKLYIGIGNCEKHYNVSCQPIVQHQSSIIL